MRYLIRLASSDPSKDNFLGSVRSLAKTTGADVRNPKWTSRGSLEIDVFVPTAADFEMFLSVLRPLYTVESSTDLNVAAAHKPERGVIAEARGYFNSERYWECHEVLEGLWRQKKGEEKLVLQGVILVCAAFVHHQKGEDEVALGVLRRAMKLLDVPASEYRGIDLQALRGRADGILSSGFFTTFEI